MAVLLFEVSIHRRFKTCFEERAFGLMLCIYLFHSMNRGLFLLRAKAIINETKLKEVL